MEDYVIEVLSELKAEKVGKERIRKDKDFLLTLDNEKRLVIMNKTGREIYNFCGNKVEKIIKKMITLYQNVNSKKISVDVIRCLRDLEHRGFVSLR